MPDMKLVASYCTTESFREAMRLLADVDPNTQDRGYHIDHVACGVLGTISVLGFECSPYDYKPERGATIKYKGASVCHVKRIGDVLKVADCDPGGTEIDVDLTWDPAAARLSGDPCATIIAAVRRIVRDR
jgi:hypothetical protein